MDYVAENFVPLAIDAVYRGNREEERFSQAIRTANNHLVAASASGKSLAAGRSLRLRERELYPVLREFQRLSIKDRKPKIKVSNSSAQRAVPSPPKNGMILRGYCSYLVPNAKRKLERQEVFYYKQNPDRWKAETQSDLMWLREDEWKTLVPSSVSVGQEVEVSSKIQHRFFSTMGIDYMEGSVSSLPVRSSAMTIVVTSVNEKGTSMRLTGYGLMGTTFDNHDRNKENSRGCKVAIHGRLHRKPNGKFDRFDIVGAGEAWGNKNHHDRNYMNLESYPWRYGVACELVKTNRPMDQVPPYNLLHYNDSGKTYFAD